MLCIGKGTVEVNLCIVKAIQIQRVYLSQGSAEKAGGCHGNEIARRVNECECEVTTKEDTNGTDDAEDDAQHETGDESFHSRPPTQSGIVHNARQSGRILLFLIPAQSPT